MNFHVGQKVVCVDDSGWENVCRLMWRVPVRWCVYTVRDTDPGSFTGEPAIRVNELINDACPSDREWNFVCSRFRPVKNTDISIFTKMLAPTPKEREPV